jgi:hypothetical protein
MYEVTFTGVVAAVRASAAAGTGPLAGTSIALTVYPSVSTLLAG